MTLKKSYDREVDKIHVPKRTKPTGVKARDEARLKHALRHGNLSVLEDDELDGFNRDGYEDDDE